MLIPPQRIPGAYVAGGRQIPGSFTAGLRALTAASSRQTIAHCRRWSNAALRISHVVPPLSMSARGTHLHRVVLLTRRTQSQWTNRQEAAQKLRQVVHSAATGPKFGFLDAGDAETLGVVTLQTGDNCYSSGVQLALWQDAHIVVSPVGAHLANLVFMSQRSAGLLQSNNCEFNTLTYSSLARACA